MRSMVASQAATYPPAQPKSVKNVTIPGDCITHPPNVRSSSGLGD